MERSELIEAATSAHRARDRAGSIRPHPAWYDLDDSGRRAAFERTLRDRIVESLVDSDGLSSTSKAVLSRIRAAGGSPGGDEL